MQGYRSGHNEAVLKTVWGNPRGFESHSLRQQKNRWLYHLFFYLKKPQQPFTVVTALGSNGSWLLFMLHGDFNFVFTSLAFDIYFSIAYNGNQLATFAFDFGFRSGYLRYINSPFYC